MCYRYIALSICFLTFFISSCFKNDSSQNQLSIQTHNTNFFVPVPLAFSSSGAPHLNVEIDNKTFTMKLDLGLRGDLSIVNTSIDQISSKKFMQKKLMYGFRGKEYLTNLYQIQKVQIGTMTFSQPILQENGEESRKDSVIIQSENAPLSNGIGRIGWELFRNTKILIDANNSQIAFCDSFETLMDYGFGIDDFIKIPLITERGLVEFEAKTLNGSLRCVLDTGSTWNILNQEISDGKSIEEAVLDPSNLSEYPSFTIGNEEFGPVAFHCVPIKLPIRIDAILGMDFFQEHLIFLDFAENFVYISKIQ